MSFGWVDSDLQRPYNAIVVACNFWIRVLPKSLKVFTLGYQYIADIYHYICAVVYQITGNSGNGLLVKIR